jgi:hypothetical protein
MAKLMARAGEGIGKYRNPQILDRRGYDPGIFGENPQDGPGKERRNCGYQDRSGQAEGDADPHYPADSRHVALPPVLADEYPHTGTDAEQHEQGDEIDLIAQGNGRQRNLPELTDHEGVKEIDRRFQQALGSHRYSQGEEPTGEFPGEIRA